jgi:hypothetical protein
MKQHSLYIIIGLLIALLVIMNNDPMVKDVAKDININIGDHGRGRADDVPPEPKRYYDSRYHDRRDMRINVPTRGEAPSYQQVGILTGADDPDNIKPLYGRQTYRGSGQWNYFTSLDSHLATKIPIYSDERDCTGEYGCKEINKTDTLNVGQADNQYTANIYQTHAPRYIPY